MKTWTKWWYRNFLNALFDYPNQGSCLLPSNCRRGSAGEFVTHTQCLSIKCDFAGRLVGQILSQETKASCDFLSCDLAQQLELFFYIRTIFPTVTTHIHHLSMTTYDINDYSYTKTHQIYFLHFKFKFYMMVYVNCYYFSVLAHWKWAEKFYQICRI